MPSMWKRMLVYLGLADDEDYVEYAEYEPEEPPARPVPPPPPAYAASSYGPDPVGTVRTIPREEPAPFAPAPRPEPAHPGATTGAVRMLPAQPSQKVHLIVPEEFVGGAKEVGDRFKAQSPVILNLAGCDRVVARRLLDYASGLTYGLSGNIKKVGDAVFLLTPKGVEVSAEDKRRYRDTGLFLDEE